MRKALLFSCLFVLGLVNVILPQKKQQASDRKSVDLTIYNVNFALIREERLIELSRGMNNIIIPDIPATIDGTSLHFSSLTDPFAVKVLEQNYQYDLVNHGKLLEKYIGKEVEFKRTDFESKKEYTVKGKLLAPGWQSSGEYSGSLIADVNGKIEINPAGNLILPSLPEGLILKPQLEWLVNSSKSGEHKMEISYIANQINWNCDYVALLNSDDNKIDLTGWVTITNFTGTTFKNAGLKLVAGDVNVIIGEVIKDRVMKYSAKVQEGEEQFQQKELFEYKLYSLQRKTDISNNETKQIELISARGVNCKKVFIYDGIADQWRYWRNNYSYREHTSFGQQSSNKVGVFVMFKNEEKAGLGIALPKGKVRVYKKDDDGKEQFVGEDLIDHTPKDEEMKLYLGNAFDIVGERVQKEFKTVVSGHVYDETFEIKIRNRKSEAVEVLVYEHPWRWTDWKITMSNVEWEKVDQTTIKFPMKVKRDEEKVIRYTVRYTW